MLVNFFNIHKDNPKKWRNLSDDNYFQGLSFLLLLLSRKLLTIDFGTGWSMHALLVQNCEKELNMHARTVRDSESENKCDVWDPCRRNLRLIRGKPFRFRAFNGNSCRVFSTFHFGTMVHTSILVHFQFFDYIWLWICQQVMHWSFSLSLSPRLSVNCAYRNVLLSPSRSTQRCRCCSTMTIAIIMTTRQQNNQLSQLPHK